MKKYWEYFKAGGLLGIVISFVMPWVNKLIGDGVYGVTLSIYNIRAEVLGFATQGNLFAKFLLNYLPGGVPALSGLPVWLVSAVITGAGVGAMVVVGKLIVETLPLGLNKKNELLAAFVLGSIGAALLVAGSLPTFAVEPLLFMVITGFILSFLLQKLYEGIGWNLPA